MATDFFGAKVKANAATPFVPRPSDGQRNEALILMNASIPATCKLPKGTRVSLMIKTETCDSVALATLIVAQQDNAKMDAALDSYAEFSVMGPKGAEIHITGHYLPKSGVEDDDEDGGAGNPLVDAFQGLLGAPSGYHSDKDSDDEEDEEDEDQSEGDDDGPGIEGLLPQVKSKKPSVSITEVKTETSSKDDGDEDSDGDDSDYENEEDDLPRSADAAHRKTNGARAGINREEEEEDDDDEEDDEEDDEMESEEDDDEDDEDGEEEKAAVKENGRLSQTVQAKEGKRGASEPSAAPAPKRMKHTKFANGFEVQQVRESSNPNAPQAQLGKTIVVKYRGTLPNGKVFDETPGNKTFSFRLGVGEVIKGWDKGLAGMRVGDKRKLVVPASMGYGDTGVAGVIPKNSTLHFEVELLRVKDGKR